MFLAFLKSPMYDRIARMTQYKDPYYASDSDNESDSDIENQYHMVRVYDDVIIQNKNNKNNNNNIIKGNQYKSDFNEADYYFVSYENTDTEFIRLCKDCLNYSAIVVCILVHILLIYIISTLYE